MRVMYRGSPDLHAHTLTDSGTLAPCSAGTNVRSAEIWVPIAGYEGDYYVSSFGRVWRVQPIRKKGGIGDRKYSHFVAQSTTPRGYLVVQLNGRTRAVHSLVLETFVGPRPAGKWARHGDGKKKNNRLDNLCWDTPRTNIHDKIEHGTICCGEKFWNARLKERDIPRVFRLSRAGHTQKAIANKFGVSQAAINRVLNGKSWKHVERPQ